MTRRALRLTAAAALVLGTTLGTSGCAVFGGGEAESCVDWPSLTTEQERTDAAELVIIGTVGERSGDERMFGVSANAWDVTVSEALKGDAEAGSTIRVVSTPETCTGATYSNGDPLETETPIVLYL
ncbi:MAG: hypothetical protein ACTJHU_11675, partial [Mycetocola sp.]